MKYDYTAAELRLSELGNVSVDARKLLPELARNGFWPDEISGDGDSVCYGWHNCTKRGFIRYFGSGEVVVTTACEVMATASLGVDQRSSLGLIQSFLTDKTQPQ